MRVSQHPEPLLSPAAGTELVRWIAPFPYGGSTVQVLALQEEHNPRGTRLPLHRHPFLEGLLILSGRGKVISGRRQPLRPGSLMLHPPQTDHAWAATGAEVRYVRLWLRITPEPPTSVLPRSWPCIPLAIQDYERLAASWRSREPGRRERLAAYVTVLLAPFLALLKLPADAEGPPPDTGANRPVSAMVDLFFADNYQDPTLSLEDVARQLHLSATTLVRRMRQETGQSVMARLRHRRLDRAAALLTGTNGTVKEIATAVGIPDSSYFCRCFRRAHGLSPDEFRVRQTAKATEEGRTGLWRLIPGT